MTLQESPGSVPAGRLPCHRDFGWDLIDSAKPGDKIVRKLSLTLNMDPDISYSFQEVTGIYRYKFDAALNVKNGFPVFSTIIKANHINKKDMFAAFHLTDNDETKTKQLLNNEQIAKQIIKSITPSIYGPSNIKTAITLSLFGMQSCGEGFPVLHSSQDQSCYPILSR